MRILKNKKADAAIFLIAIISLVAVGLAYIGLFEATNQSLEKINETAFTYTGGHHEQSVMRQYDLVRFYPILATFIIVLWAILWTKNRKDRLPA